ncbi:MAG TPA: hypothetical protein VF728_05170, partial [Nocardioides sp.]
DGTAHVSWNGATEVARWRLLGGTALDSLAEVTTVDRTGFETSVAYDDGHEVVQLEALDARGDVLGASSVVATSGPVRQVRA